MSMLIRPAESSDLDAVLSLLSASGLAVEGLADNVSLLLIATAEAGVTACAALEVDGPDALLRSVAVESTVRNSGMGTKLVARIEEEARKLGVERLYLLTTTAEDFFEGLGYSRVDRDRVPDVVRASAEFSACAAADATAMCRSFRASRVIV